MRQLSIAPAICAALVFGPCLTDLASAQAPEAPPEQAHDLSTRFTIDPKDPEGSVPSPEEAMKNPLEMGYLMMDMIARAEAATQRGEHATAARYYRALSKAVPERAVAFSKLCKTYEALGRRAEAIEACRTALGKGGVEVSDYRRFVQLTLQKAESLTPSELEDVDAIVAHLDTELGKDPKGKTTVTELRCEIATKLEDTARLKQCVQDLTTLEPDAASTLTFGFALALSEHDLEAARDIVAQAKAKGLPQAALSRMETTLSRESDKPSGWLSAFGGWVAFAVLSATALLGLIWGGRRKPRLHAA